MASNFTSLIDDIFLLDNTSSSTVSDSPFPEPADPFDGYLNITDSGIFENGNGTIGTRIFDYLNFESWHIYVICAVAAFVIVLAVIGLVVWLGQNKRKIINGNRNSVLTSNYPDETSFCCCFSCGSHGPSVPEIRQNSASNLESYGRPQLPTSAYEAQRRRNSQESYTIDTSNLAMYIDTIKEIPNIDVSAQNRRPLPHHDVQQYLYRH